ncbi:MAG: LysR family transcriptional regulator [Myxococcales bacterium]|nr:MAG: LysR family transcriptional regulator [Myxococcales bacterium]
MRGVDTNLIVALHALLRHQNVTRAAREVGLGQSSMSHALARLRAHFDDPLLVPVGRTMVLTERARGLVEPVSEAVARLERVFTPPEPFEPRTSRRVFRVAATDNLALYVLPRLAATLQRSAPGIDVRVCALPADWATSLLRGEIDLKLGRKAPVPRSLDAQELSREELACVVRRGHPVRARPGAAEYAALDHLLIAPTASVDATPSGAVDVALARRGLARRVAMSVPHFLVAPFIVAQSNLVLTAPARLLAPFVDSLDLRRLTLPVRLPGYRLSQVWAAHARDDEGHRWLRAAVAAAME